MPPVTTRIATLDRALEACVVSSHPLRYETGEDSAQDRPAHVRAASSIAWIGDRIALVQDDSNFVAMVQPTTGTVQPIALPRGEGGLRNFDDGRGNKKYKLDLEACVALPGQHESSLLAFGSGSKKRRRNVATIDRWTNAEPRVRLHDATTLYERLEAEVAFAGSDMNIEGALVSGNCIRFFGRGNGKPKNGLLPLNATCELTIDQLFGYLENTIDVAPPEPISVVQYDLGQLNDIVLGFTDATSMGDNTLFSAAAEVSADASEDGPVGGSVLGTIDARGVVRYTVLVDQSGRPFMEKVEGVVLSKTDATRAFIVIDPDDVTRPGALCEVELRGSW